MKRIDIENNESLIEEFLDRDNLGRNINLNSLVSFLNNLEKQLILNLDDNWGTGKTVFLKQLEYLGKTKKEDIPNISSKKIQEFQKNYEIFYFNAWEHDLYSNPLESLINSLLMKMSEINEEELAKEQTLEWLTNKLKELGTLGANIFLRSITAGQIDLGTIKSDAEKDINPIVTSIDVKRNAINEIVNQILESTGKKLLIIVDELDRCKPTYAIEFLEVIKHFFLNDDVIFLFGTNKKELSETIKGEYGSNFDGYKYLNRFFDFEFSLPPISKDTYLRNFQLGRHNGSSIYNVQVNVAKFFNFTMRDLNRYAMLCDICVPYFFKHLAYHQDEYQRTFLLPFAIGLKIDSGEKFNKFIIGDGLDVLKNFYHFDEERHSSIISESLRRQGVAFNKQNLSELCWIELLEFNEELKGKTNEHSDRAYAMEEILEVLSMMCDHTA